ncbi:MAP7 domain-containing protein 3 isoform X2 [Hyaena hyaena]|uniref:MAP7 domain-containing protein 3 isoform X2 n=1 Tax=Hyaena hyaena TaxID=95912 RepID=UPI0019239436|nr:MAP7 domain-containing protein 3 isoform X2 [Hyaena hyaena]
MAERAGTGGSTSLRGLRERMVAAAHAMAEERRNQSGFSSLSQSSSIKSSVKPVIDGSILKSDAKQRLVKERREEKKKQQDANKETQLLEKERKSRIQYEKQMEEKHRKLKEQKEKDEQRRISAEEKRKQKLHEERERFKAVVYRTLERSNRVDHRQKRWSWEGSTAVNPETKNANKRSVSSEKLEQEISGLHKQMPVSSAGLQNSVAKKKPEKRSSSLNRRSSKLQSPMETEKVGEKPVRHQYTSVRENNLISRLLIPTKASMARSKSAVSLSVPGKETPGSRYPVLQYVNMPLRSHSSDELKNTIVLRKSAMAVPPQENVGALPKAEGEAVHKERMEGPPKAKVEAPPKVKVEASPKAEVEAPCKAEVEAPRKAEVEAPPKAEVEAPRKAEVEAPPKAEVEAPPKAEVEAPHKAEVEAPHKAEVEAPRKTEVEVPSKADVEAPPKVKVEAPPKVSAGVEVASNVNVEVVPEANVEVAPEVNEATPQASMEGSPEESVDASLQAGVEAFPESVETSPEVSVDMSLEGSVDPSPEVSMDSSLDMSADASPDVSIQVSSEASGEASPKASAVSSPEASVEALPKESAGAPPEASLEKPEMDKQASNPSTKKRPSSHIPCYKWPSSPASGWRPPSPISVKQMQKNRPPSPSPVMSKQSQPSLCHKGIPVPRNLLAQKVLGTLGKKREAVSKTTSSSEAVSQKQIICEDAGSKSTPGSLNAEEATKILAEKRRLAREQKEKEERLQKETEERKVTEMTEKEVETQGEEFLKLEDGERENEIKKKECPDPEDKTGLLQKGDAKIKAQEEADERKKEHERIMLQNLQERLERKKRIEEIMKRTRKTYSNTSQAAEALSDRMYDEDEADDEDESESESDAFDDLQPSAFINGMDSSTIFKTHFKNTKKNTPKLVFLDATSGQVHRETKTFFNGDMKTFRQKSAKDPLTQAKGTRSSSKRISS